MEDRPPPESLTELLDRMEDAAEGKDEVSLDEVMDAVGRRSFGPLLLLVGVIAAAPGVGDIPGVATLLGVFVLVVSVQLLFGRDHFWLPQWMLKRCVSRERLKKTTESKWLRAPARWTDEKTKERLKVFTGRAATYVIAAACTIMACTLPLTEAVPFSTTGVSLGFVAFGLSLIANDGLMGLLGFVIGGATLGLVLMAIVG